MKPPRPITATRRRLRVVPTGRPEIPDLLTVEEVADKLRCSTAHVHSLFSRGLVSVKVGSRRRVSVQALADFIERNTERAS